MPGFYLHRYVYPDFLPNPVYYFRDKIREKLERRDMIERRKQINVPEFYVGKFNIHSNPSQSTEARFNNKIHQLQKVASWLLLSQTHTRQAKWTASSEFVFTVTNTA